MTGKTHRLGGVVVCLGGYMALQSNNMLVPQVDPLLQLAVLYPFAVYGSTVSDLDHHWKSAPSKDPISWIINKLLHLSPKSSNTFLNAKHRSWQTHSDLFLFIMLWVGMLLFNSTTDGISQAIIRLIFTGLVFGIISHLVLDMLTPQGIWSILLMGVKKLFGVRGMPVKLDLVPDTKFFATDGPWEHGVRLCLWVVAFILLAVILISRFPGLLA